MRSDLWVFRYIWDTVEQQEVLAAIVGDAVNARRRRRTSTPAAPTRAPDPESLARDLDDLEKRLSDPATTPADRSRLKDRLGVLAGRCEWIKDERYKRVLRPSRVETLFSVVANERRERTTSS